MKINSRWITDLNATMKSMKLLEVSTAEYLHILLVGQVQEEITIKNL